MDDTLAITDLDRDFDSAEVGRAWEAFVAGEAPPGAAVREHVRASWLRCAERGLAPRGPVAPMIGDASTVEARRAASRELLVVAEHTWEVLSESLAASDNIFMVTDAEGVILDVRGNAEFVAAAARHHVAPGRDWSEAASGTNAIAMTLALGRPAVVRSSEHYVESAKIWDCAAAPIRDLSDGTLLGVLDVTSVGDLSDSHTLALAVTAAHQVEHTLHSQALARSVQLLHWFQSDAARWHDRAAVLVDRKGRVIHATDLAQTEVGAPPPFEIGADGPVAANGLGILETCAYRPPADTPGADGASGWLGGVVVVESAARTAAATARTEAAAPVPPAFRRIVTADAGVLALMRRAERMARANSPILLLGETGSGKELFARAIHDSSPVADGPFVAVNCGTLTKELAASELLGYEAGAFTGASKQGRSGKFEQAHGGTLFLDEVGELPADVQVHLLRVLQDQRVVRVGGNAERRVDVRIIAATHRDLEHDAATGRFRSDLLFRLRVLTLELPPLRARRGDVALLVAAFLQRLQATYGLGARTASGDLLERLAAHPWPGNVRELEGLIESLYILSDRSVLTPSDLPADFGAGVPRAAPDAVSSATRGGRLDHLERTAIEDEIARQGHNMTAVARRLGISRSTLYRKLRQYGIAPRPA